MKRKFKVAARVAGGGTVSGILQATDHRNAVQLFVNMHHFPAGTEVDVIEVSPPPALSTYIVLEHTSLHIEMKV